MPFDTGSKVFLVFHGISVYIDWGRGAIEKFEYLCIGSIEFDDPIV